MSDKVPVFNLYFLLPDINIKGTKFEVCAVKGVRLSSSNIFSASLNLLIILSAPIFLDSFETALSVASVLNCLTCPNKNN